MMGMIPLSSIFETGILLVGEALERFVVFLSVGFLGRHDGLRVGGNIFTCFRKKP